MTRITLTTVSWHSSGSTQCFVASHPEAIIIAFRGTELPEFNDFATDLKAAQQEGLVGGRFTRAFWVLSRKWVQRA